MVAKPGDRCAVVNCKEPLVVRYALLTYGLCGAHDEAWQKSSERRRAEAAFMDFTRNI
jgi:hypothetical protein